jgi:Cu(I)/Ag(I) efflux system membrane protein CusA/SilA
MHFRSILIVTIPLPLAVLLSFLGMHYVGLSANIMSLAGIAIAIGVLVDAGIVVTENAFRFLELRQVDPTDRRRVWETVLESTRLVGRPVFFSMAIILLAFVPVFALGGQEGKLFHPLAFTKTFAVLTATVIPSRWCRSCAPCCSRGGSTRRIAIPSCGRSVASTHPRCAPRSDTAG